MLIVVVSLFNAIITTASTLSVTNELLILDGHPFGSRAVLVSSDHNESCQFFGQSDQIQFIENLPDRPSIRKVNQQEWSNVFAECQEQLLFQNQTPNPSNIHFIYPGTKWCGPGNIANSYDDLGTRVATDMCCRDHDNCDDSLNPGSCKNGLCNNSVFTKSNCRCDEKLRQCLLNSNDRASTPVGIIYFNVAAVSCYTQSPDCLNKDFKRRERKYSRDLPIDQRGWCFIRPETFRKSRRLLPWD